MNTPESEIKMNYKIPGWKVDWAWYQEKITQVHDTLHGRRISGNGWVDWPERIPETLIAEIEQTAKEMQQKCSVLVTIGVGGSYLGARACIELLKSPFYNERYASGERWPKVYFAGHHLSSNYYYDLLEKLDTEEDVCVCVISKSGTTMEPMIVFDLMRRYMTKRYGKEEAAKRIYVVTGEAVEEEDGGHSRLCDATATTKNPLYRCGQSNGYRIFTVPENIGGRYSVLTPVGLLPIAAAGIHIRELLEGAREAQQQYRTPELTQNACYRYGLLRYMLQMQGKIIEIFEVYEGKLRYFTEWLKQLFGESECKEGCGILPLSLQMSTDLHSMGQFLQEGRQNFFETVLTVEELERNLPLQDIDAAGAAAGMHELNAVIQESVRKAHEHNATPQLRLTIRDISPASYGHMVYFFEKACAVSCLLNGINPFDQPGVEAYKHNILDAIK